MVQPLRCIECQIFDADVYRCETCGDQVCDDCTSEHPCNWISYEDESEEEDDDDY